MNIPTFLPVLIHAALMDLETMENGAGKREKLQMGGTIPRRKC